jgi:hypothetical protein
MVNLDDLFAAITDEQLNEMIANAKAKKFAREAEERERRAKFLKPKEE